MSEEQAKRGVGAPMKGDEVLDQIVPFRMTRRMRERLRVVAGERGLEEGEAIRQSIERWLGGGR